MLPLRLPFQLCSPTRPAHAVAATEHLVSWRLAQPAVAAISAWPGYAPTPVVPLPGLARAAGVGAVAVKYEGGRFGIGSFKALGGAYAVACAGRDAQAQGRDPSDLTFATASDGNHGLSVAWGARRLGARCVVFLHRNVSAGRARLIEEMGARIVRVAGNYDDSTREAAARSEQEGWILVADTSLLAHDPLPIAVMAGYGTMVDELAAQFSTDTAPTHLFLQGGCGGLAAAVCGLIRERWPFAQPTLVVVEPERAACLFESARAGRMVHVEGDLDTIMGGLSVGEPSALAWPVLAVGVDHFMTIPDAAAKALMRAIARGRFADAPLEIGDSGIAGLAGLVALAAAPDALAKIGLDASSRVLAIATEGPVDRATFDAILSEPEMETAP